MPCARILVTHSGLIDRLPAKRRPHALPRCRRPADRTPARHRVPLSALDPHNPAYVIYTSGSTEPKRRHGHHTAA